MEVWLLPVSLLEKRYVIDSCAVIPLLLYAIFCMYEVMTKRSIKIIKINKSVFAFILVALLAQTLIIVLTFKKVMSAPGSPPILNGIIGWYFMVLSMIVDCLVINLCISDFDSIVSFVRSIYWTFIFFSVVVLLPQLIAVSTNLTDRWVNLLAKFFEERHKDRNDFYWAGSYATTLGRINGFTPEASFLAAQIGIVFIPLFLASIKNKFDLFTQRYTKYSLFNWSLLIFSFILLVFAKTSTGFVVIALACLILFLDSNLKSKIIYLVIGCVSFGCLAIMFFKVQSFQDILMKYVFAKQGTSNRLGGTIGLIKTFLSHPIFGVGNGYHSYYLLKLVPQSTTNNSEFHNVFMVSGYPAQSKLFGFFANYGLVIMLPVIIYVFQKITLALRIKRITHEIRDIKNSFYTTILDSFIYFICMYVVLSLFSFTWNENYYVLMFMFYVLILGYIKNRVVVGDAK